MTFPCCSDLSTMVFEVMRKSHSRVSHVGRQPEKTSFSEGGRGRQSGTTGSGDFGACALHQGRALNTSLPVCRFTGGNNLGKGRTEHLLLTS